MWPSCFFCLMFTMSAQKNLGSVHDGFLIQLGGEYSGSDMMIKYLVLHEWLEIASLLHPVAFWIHKLRGHVTSHGLQSFSSWVSFSNPLSQWLNFKLSGITCLVGKIKFKLLSEGPLAE